METEKSNEIGKLKQSLLTPFGTPLAIRFTGNSITGGVSAATPGVTYVLQSQPHQPTVTGTARVLRPLSLVPQQQQINGIGGVGGNGSQVVIRRFPNNNVVHVRRIATQQQQYQQNHQQQPPPVQKIGVLQTQPVAAGGASVLVTNVNNGGVPPAQPHQQLQLPVSVPLSTSTAGGNYQQHLTSSELESDEFEEGGGGDVGKGIGGRITRSRSHVVEKFKPKNQLNGGSENQNDNNTEKTEEKLPKKLVVVGKRKRSEEENDDDEEGDLLIDEVEDHEDDQDGDVIDDEEDDGKDGDRKSALELNGTGVDSGFLRHVIETQILNRHKTRIKDWDGTKGHMCQSCHESFLSESGLETHRNRRIHHILFFCRCCKRDLSFFNKCRLLQHLRNHRVTPTVSSLQNCTMIRLLPESDYLHFKYEDCTSSSDDEDDDEEEKHSSTQSAGGSVSSSGNGNSTPPKKLKPSKFRRIARSSITGRESDNSPPPVVTKQIVAPPQLSSPPLTAENSATTIVPTLNNSSNNVAVVVSAASVNNAVGTIKFANSGGGVVVSREDASVVSQPQKASQVAVIKSTGNTTSVILPSVITKPITTALSKEASPRAGEELSDGPQIRIRNLSQLTVAANEDDMSDNDNQDEFEGEEDDDKLDIAPRLESQVRLVGNESSVTSENCTAAQAVIVAKEYHCYKCEKMFRTGADLFQHLEEAEQVGFSSRSLHRCPTDDIPSWSQCLYVFHTKVFHEKSVPFMCPGCGEESPDYNGLLEHVANHCFYLSQRARYMCAATVSKCSFSDRKSVKTEPEIIDHLKKEHSRSVLQCLHCTQGFATDNWLLKHLAETHGIQLDDSKGTEEREALINKTTRPLTQCLICNILFPNGPTYLQHVYLNFHMHILHAKMLECQNCLAVFETQAELFAHRNENEACRKLDPFTMKISEGANEKGNGGSPPTVAAVSIAPTPLKIVTNPVASTTVLQTNPSQLKPMSSITPRSQPGSVGGTSSTVTVISTAASSPNEIKPPTLSPQQPIPQHRSHQVIAKQPTNCNQPNSSQMIPSSSSNNSGNIATTNVTPNVKNKNPVRKNVFENLLSCQFCERLVVFSSLRKHEDQCCGLSTVDPGFCLTCKQYFGDRARLARHGIVHIQEDIPICLFCNNRHIRPTHPKSTTPSAHENLYALKKHLYSNHTSKIIQFPYKCHICSTWLADKRACEFHIKDHQFKYRVKVGERDPSPIEISPEDRQKMVRVRQKGLDPRKKAITKTTEVYYCPVCKNREFAWESGLARHLKLVHQKNPKTINLKLLKKPSTARRFVVKAPETANAMLGVGIQHAGSSNNTGGKPILRSVVSGGGPIGSSLSSVLQKARTVPLVGAGASKVGNNNTVTVSSTSSNNSFTSRFSSSIVLRKRLASTASSVSTTGRKIGTGTGLLPQRQLPNTRQRTCVGPTTIVSAPAKSNLTAHPSSSTPRAPPNFLHTRSSSAAAAALASSSKTCRRKDGTITCLKCPDFLCKSENEFCEHVKWKHVWPDSEIQKLKFGVKLEDPSEFWCPECNAMFVAKPSLVRHLKYAHDYITSAEEYMLKIGYDGKKPVKSHQCDVCYYECADDRELQQHMRTHGMAFLRLRQQRQMSMANNK